MLKTVLKYRFVALFVLAIFFYYFFVRLPNLTLQPIFADEAIYVRWAQVMRSEPTLRFISLTDGKTPLYMWLMIPLFKVFSDPLLAGRFLSVMSGFGTLVGVLVLGWHFLNRRVGIWAAFLIAASPYMIFFDRMALVDSMLAAFGVWSVLLALAVVRYRRIDLAMILGFCLGGGMLTKTPGYFNVLMSPIALISLDWRNAKVLKNRVGVMLLVVLSMIIAMVVYNLLRLGPGFDSLSSRNADYIHPMSRLWEIPFDPLFAHLRDMAEWFPIWIGWPTIVFILVGVAKIVAKKDLVGLAILGWALIPLLVEASLLKTFTTRYILSSIPLLLIIAAVGVDVLLVRFRNRFVHIIVLILLVIPSLWFVYLSQTVPENAPMPKESRRGYFEDWTAGYGLREIAEYLQAESRNKKIIVGTEGTFGTLPDGLRIYFDKNTNTIFTSGNGSYYKELRKEAGRMDIYYVMNSESRLPAGEGLELIKSYTKAQGADNMQLETRLLKVSGMVELSE